MNKDQLARLARHRKVQQVLSDHATTVAQVPAFARLAAEYLRQLGLLDGTARRTGAPAEGATLAKSTAGTALIARLVKAANALYLVYKAETPANIAEATQLHRRASDYVNMGDQALATEAADLAQRVAAQAVVLKKEYNWDAAAITALTTEAQAFAAQLTAPQLAIDAAKLKGATAKATLSALNVFLRDDLRAGMELLSDTHPEAYQALREASQVDDTRRGRGGKKVRKLLKAVRLADVHLSAGPAVTMALAEGSDPNQTVYLVAGDGDVFVFFEMDFVVGDDVRWQSSMAIPLVPRADHHLADRRLARLDSEDNLKNTAKEWTITMQNAHADKEATYTGRVVLVQASSRAEALNKLPNAAMYLYNYAPSGTIAVGSSILEKGLVSFF